MVNDDDFETCLEFTTDDPPVTYEMSAELDDEYCIMDISRLSARLLLAE